MNRSAALAAFLVILFTGTALAESSKNPQIVAQANPTPAPTAHPLTLGGYFRGYYFARTNASPQYGLPQSTGVVNQATFNAALALHAAYNVDNWTVAGTYLYANPLDNCTTAADQVESGGPCSGKTATYKSGGVELSVQSGAYQSGQHAAGVSTQHFV